MDYRKQPSRASKAKRSNQESNYQVRSKRKKLPPAQVEPSVALEATTVVDTRLNGIVIADEVAEEIERDTQALVYRGFDVNSLRRKLFLNIDITDNNAMIVKAKMIARALVAYAAVGSNVSKITGKVTDAVRARTILADVSSLGIKMKASAPDDPTLPRIAIAYMPAYLIYRKASATKLQNQTQSRLNVAYKDLVFAGSPNIFRMDGYLEFYREFSMMIDPEIEDEDDVNLDWIGVAQDGYLKDQYIHGLIEKVESGNLNSINEMIKMIIRIQVNCSSAVAVVNAT